MLFLGRLGRERGLEEAAEAVLRLDDAALVMLGFGPWADRLRERDADPTYRRPPLHAAAGPSRRRPGVDRLGRRLDHRRARELAEPAAVDAEQVLGEPDRRARRSSSAATSRSCARSSRPTASARSPTRPTPTTSLAASARSSSRARSGWPGCATAASTVTRTTYNWETAVEPYLALVARPRCRAGGLTAQLAGRRRPPIARISAALRAARLARVLDVDRHDVGRLALRRRRGPSRAASPGCRTP